jgi:anthranilate synthase component I
VTVLTPPLDISPTLDSFAARYDAGQAQIVHTTLVADLETPVSARIKLGGDAPYTFLFESVEGGTTRGRYSFIVTQPDLIWRCRDGQVEVAQNAAAFAPDARAPFDSLRALLAESRLELEPGMPPMATGLFGYLGYAMVRQIEPSVPDTRPDPLGIPDAILVRPTIVAVFDRLEDVVSLFTPVRPEHGVSAQAAYAQATARLAAAVTALRQPLPDGSAPNTGALPEGAGAEPVSNTSRDRFMDMVEHCKDYIRAGDAFQVVPSQRFSLPFTLPSMAFYRALRRLNPSPFLFHLDFGDFAVVGSSPEILVRLRQGTVTIRPLAGTRRRGKTVEEDKALEHELLADPKELAEHLMLLDLGRNDVGRVARIGSVKAPVQFEVERYRYVMHISSTVEGQIAEGQDALSALMAGFPAGTLSGAPKVRAMQIIDELETHRRGLYAGAIGYFGADGDMDTCIALRTALIKDGVLYAQAGAGVVADSDPAAEYQETIDKARALIRAAHEASRYAPGG